MNLAATERTPDIMPEYMPEYMNRTWHDRSGHELDIYIGETQEIEINTGTPGDIFESQYLSANDAREAAAHLITLAEHLESIVPATPEPDPAILDALRNTPEGRALQSEGWNKGLDAGQRGMYPSTDPYRS